MNECHVHNSYYFSGTLLMLIALQSLGLPKTKQ